MSTNKYRHVKSGIELTLDDRSAKKLSGFQLVEEASVPPAKKTSTKNDSSKEGNK